MAEQALDAILEIFAWIGVGTGLFVLAFALILRLADGTWFAARAVVEESDSGRLVRWFDHEGGVGEAALSHDQDRQIGTDDMADIFYRQGVPGRMRLTRHSPAVRAVTLLGLGLLGVGVLAFAASVVVLFIRG